MSQPVLQPGPVSRSILLTLAKSCKLLKHKRKTRHIITSWKGEKAISAFSVAARQIVRAGRRVAVTDVFLRQPSIHKSLRPKMLYSSHRMTAWQHLAGRVIKANSDGNKTPVSTLPIPVDEYESTG